MWMLNGGNGVWHFILLFEKDNEIKSSEPYQLLERLFREQCEFRNDHPSDEESSKIQIKKKSEGETLQSPYDPDASTDIKAQDTAFISPRHAIIPGKLKSSPTMKSMVPPVLISARLFQLSSVWTLPG